MDDTKLTDRGTYSPSLPEGVDNKDNNGENNDGNGEFEIYNRVLRLPDSF